MLPLLVSVIALLVGPAAQPLAKDADQLAKIKSAYDQFNGDLRGQRFDDAKQLFTSDFTIKLADGHSLTRDEYIERLRQAARAVKSIDRITYEVERSQARGTDMQLVVRTRVFITDSDWRDPQKDVAQFTDDLSEDTWTRSGEDWKLRASVRLRGTINAEVTPHEDKIASPRLAALAKEWKSGNHAAVDAFWSEIAGKAPLVEEDPKDNSARLVTFLWRGKDGVTMFGGLPSSEPKTLTRLYESDLWYRTEEIPSDGRGTYAFQVEDVLNEGKPLHFSASVPDPLNPHAYSYGSVFELPSAPAQSYLKERKEAPKGTLTRLKIKSSYLNEERDYSVYTPAGFDANVRAHKLLVLFDGEQYGNRPDPPVPAPTILNNLIADKKLPPVVMVLVNHVSDRLRNRDLTCSDNFENFLAKELVPTVQKQFNASKDPQDIVVGGSSFGGLAAACSGLMHPEVFGNVLSQSGSYWYVRDWLKQADSPYYTNTGYVIEEFARREKLPLRFYLEIGRFDDPAQMLATNRHLRDVLRLKGYPVFYSEFEGGHDYLCWRGSLADGLIALLGTDKHFQSARSTK